jgi:hypothetical protein
MIGPYNSHACRLHLHLPFRFTPWLTIGIDQGSLCLWPGSRPDCTSAAASCGSAGRGVGRAGCGGRHWGGDSKWTTRTKSSRSATRPVDDATTGRGSSHATTLRTCFGRTIADSPATRTS